MILNDDVQPDDSAAAAAWSLFFWGGGISVGGKDSMRRSTWLGWFLGADSGDFFLD